MSSSGPRVTVVDQSSAVEVAIRDLDAGGPRPVVLLIGGAAGFDDGQAELLYPVIRDGIVALAEELNASIVDGGTDSGVMALAGRARAELGAKFPLVGVAPASRVRMPGSKRQSGTTALEPNHSHHFLVPGRVWGDESPALLKTADAIAAGNPVVAVLVDGGA
ncbi:MAG: hypothetical protein ABIP53_03730, partial [Candidatus Limnocylindrales bacterium]